VRSDPVTSPQSSSRQSSSRLPNSDRVARGRGVTAVMGAVSLLGAILVSFSVGSVPASAKTPIASDPALLVNPFIGTANGGDTFPGADVPFGMVQWSPDTVTRPDGGGYSYDSPSIIGYSLTHLSGPGCQAEGDVPILPTVGPIGPDPTNTTERLRHTHETATPGYYQLDAGGVNTQLTTTTRSGMATFTFPSTASEGNLLFKLSDSETPVASSDFHVVSDVEVVGSVTSGFFCGATATYTLHFDMLFNRPFASSGAWTTGGNGGYVTFDTSSDEVVQAKVGISYVSTKNAVLNRTVENPGWNFNSVKDAAERSWQLMLSKIQVRGGTATERTVFYTALYHSLLEPNVFSDVNGQYMGYDKKVHTVVKHQMAQYANYSGWDIYRSEVQLLSLLAPQKTEDIVTSMLNDYAQTGQLPKWSEDDGEDYIMVGDPADGIIADAYAFGAKSFNARQALSDMETEATVPSNIRPGLNDYESDGYLPVDGTYGCCNFYGPVSTQQEYDTADNAISLLAAELGDSKVADTFATRAQNWQNVFNPGTGFLQPKKSSGQFQPSFRPTSDAGFVEADAYIYTAMVPFDLHGVIAAEGGDQAWVDYLNGLTSSVTAMGATQIQMGNEPSFDIPWEYDYAGDPSGTQRVVREIQDELYTDTPGGLAGNDDLGAMSSWFVWSAIGAYPEMPGSATLAIGSPLFSSITLDLANGKTITETAPAASERAPFVEKLTIDGSSWDGAYLPPSLLSAGGSLAWTLGTAATSWGNAVRDAPPSDTRGLLPALGYLAGKGDTLVAPGGTATLTLGLQSMSRKTQQISWTVSESSNSGIAVTPANGTFIVHTEAKASQPVEIEVASNATEGQYVVTFSLRTNTGKVLPAVVAEVDVV
jgi:predicted alpha-1,2-mannosidase